MQSEPSVSVTTVDGRLESVSVTIGDDIQVFTLRKIKKLRRRSDAHLEEHPYDPFERAAIRAYFNPPSDESFAEMEEKAQANSLGHLDPIERVNIANGR